MGEQLTIDSLLPPCICDGLGWTAWSDDNGVGFARRCVGCLRRSIARQFGGKLALWETWQERQELATAVKRLRSWKPGGVWCALLHDAAHEPGNFGAGKTHALQAVAHEWAELGVDVKFVAMPDYLHTLRKAAGGAGAPEEIAWFRGLLILDDLGAGATTPWVQEVVEQLADVRYRKRLPLAAATNLTIRALGEKFPRFTDRAHEGLVLAWSAPSFRRR